MTTQKCVIGIDFGTESARAVLVDCGDGNERATSVYAYETGVIDDRLPPPNDDVRLDPDWALQDPAEYLSALSHVVPEVVEISGIDPANVIGVGIDFTSCTILPTKADGTPLCFLDNLRRKPHAWVKLWKHHAAQPEADEINRLAQARAEEWLARYGGKISSEWFFPKALQILRDAPDLYAQADRIIEAADWIVWQLTGVETRNGCTAGYKAMWSKEQGFPSREFFAALDPRFADVVDEKMSRSIVSTGGRAGGLSERAAELTGLRAGTAVAVANVDAHVSMPAAGITEPGRFLMIMGTSTCDILLADRGTPILGICGVVEDGVLPGCYGYEAGQSAVGDIFGWFVEHCVPPGYHDRAAADGTSVHRVLEQDASECRAGESGLLALDWWNGNRSVLVNADLSGLLMGMTLATRPAEIYRALIEATAFGARTILERLEQDGVPIEEIVACGGLPERNELLMQIYADVLGRPISVAAASHAPALGSAIFAAVAAGSELGGFDRIEDAVARIVRPPRAFYVPEPAEHEIYDLLYAEYLAIHDLFGRGGLDVMARLGQIAHERATERSVSTSF